MQRADHKTAASNYITPEGHRRLHDELTELWTVKRPKVTEAVAEAAAMGDRSENAEYIYGKRQLRHIDSRIRFLKKKLEKLVIVDRKPADRTKIYFGAWVELEDNDGNSYQYRIVGPDEIDPAKNYISIDSPMAKTLLRRSEGDEITVRRPNGDAGFVITAIRY